MRTGARGRLDAPSWRDDKEAGEGGWQVTLYVLSGGRVNRKWGRALKPQCLPSVTHFLQLRLHPKGSTVSQTSASGENQAFKHTSQWETLHLLITTEASLGWGILRVERGRVSMN